MQKRFEDILDINVELLESDVASVSIFLPSTGFYPKGTIVKKLVAGYYPKNNNMDSNDCKLGLILTGKTTQIVCIQVENENLLSEDVRNAFFESNTLNSIERFEEFPEKELIFSKNYFFKVNVGPSVGNFFVDQSCIDSYGFRVIYGTPVRFLGSFHPPKKDKMIFSSNIKQIQDLPILLRDTLRPIDAVEDFIFSPVSRVKLENINGCSNRSVLKPGKNICFSKDLHTKESMYSYTMSICRKGEGRIFLFCTNEECKIPLRKIAEEINVYLEQDEPSTH